MTRSNLILEALRAGDQTTAQISHRLGVSTAMVCSYLSRMQIAGFVRRILPEGKARPWLWAPVSRAGSVPHYKRTVQALDPGLSSQRRKEAIRYHRKHNFGMVRGLEDGENSPQMRALEGLERLHRRVNAKAILSRVGLTEGAVRRFFR
jgi:hypothetical protein